MYTFWHVLGGMRWTTRDPKTKEKTKEERHEQENFGHTHGCGNGVFAAACDGVRCGGYARGTDYDLRFNKRIMQTDRRTLPSKQYKKLFLILRDSKRKAQNGLFLLQRERTLGS